ncbi:MAG: glycoside hydrolase family 16 protein [Bacteroidota bacterium]
MLLAFFITILFVNCSEPIAEADKPQLVWYDEFEYEGQPDPAKWSYDYGDGCPTLCGWGNNERQFYTKNLENAHVEDGKLIITAIKENHNGRNYTSARLVSKEKGDWLYGRIEVRAKMPSGIGTWPAIWMLPTDWAYGGWPASGEIDIIEHVGFEPLNVYGNIHVNKFNGMHGTDKPGCLKLKNSESEFNTYAISWTEDKIEWFVNDEIFHTYENKRKGIDEWPFDQRFHLIMNIAVGGNWGGKKGIDDSIWPQQLIIDYVRVYQNKT